MASLFSKRNKVPYNIFQKWYKDMRNKIVEVRVEWNLSYSALVHLIEKLEGLC